MTELYGTPRRRWRPEINGEVAVIPLTQGRFAQVDVDDLPLIAPFAWRLHRGPHTAYAATACGRRAIYMHRLIQAAPAGVDVDHIDRDGLNNRRGNHRLCSRAENSRRRASTAGATPFKGAALHRASGLYHATIVVGGRQLSLGYHLTPEAAARAYDEGALKHFGEFALTNKELGLL